MRKKSLSNDNDKQGMIVLMLTMFNVIVIATTLVIIINKKCFGDLVATIVMGMIMVIWWTF